MKLKLKIFLPFLFLCYHAAISQKLSNLQLIIRDSIEYENVKNGKINNQGILVGVQRNFSTVVKNNNPIHIAIDPGHIATSMAEAKIEDRFITSKEGSFYEAQLTAATAYELKRLFEQQGFLVTLTRGHNSTALGKSYLGWYKKDRKFDLANELAQGRMTQSKYDELIKADKKTLFFKYYRDKEMIARAQKINSLSPDLTLVLHYNSSEFDSQNVSTSPIVQHNYSVAFIPGAFTNYELDKDSEKEDLIRLVSSDQIQQSISLSSFIISEFEDKLNVPALDTSIEELNDLWYINKYCVATDVKGVYARNLYMTRAIKSPVCYGESLLQNNSNEIQVLSKKDISINGMKTSSRVLDVANAYYVGTLKYLASVGKYKFSNVSN